MSALRRRLGIRVLASKSERLLRNVAHLHALLHEAIEIASLESEGELGTQNAYDNPRSWSLVDHFPPSMRNKVTVKPAV